MKKRATFFLIAIFVFTSGNCVEKKDVVNSEDYVREVLARAGVEMGFDGDKGRMVALGTGFFALGKENDEADDSFEWHYDFSDAADDDFETRRFKAMWRAYADGLADIAEGIQSDMDMKCSEVTNCTGEVVSEVVSEVRSGVSVKSSIELAGVAYLTMAESMNDGIYAVSVAVGQSKKREECYSRASRGVASTLGKSSLAEWIELDRNSATGIICPQTYCDNEGRWWRIAGVPVDLAAGRNSKKVALLTERARRYAYEAAIRTIAVRVSKDMQTMKVESKSKNGTDVHLEKMKLTVKIDPMNTVLPVDSSQIKFFELDRVNSLTGNPVRCVVAALRSGAGKSEAKDTPAPLARRVVHEPASAEKTTSNDRQMDAEEQAHKFCEENGLELGLDVERKIIALIAGEAFEYEKTMSDEEFARKRYLAVQRAFMMGAVDIARQIEQVADVSDRERRAHGFGRDWMFALGHVADEENDEGWIPQLMRQMTGREFSWMASLVGSRGTAKMEFPLYGLSIVRQFESLSEDVYQVALIVSLDMKKGKDEIMSFIEGKTVRSGDMSLRQWMDTQDFGLVAGPRRFVDNEGTIWALGIVPATEGQQPYGTLLDAAARECAAFAFGGDLAVSIKEEDSLRSITGSGDKAGDAENPKDGSFIKFKSVVCYPRELEQYFHRTYTHPVTGWKGVVAICALRSGSSKIMKEIYAQKIKKAREKKREEGMRAGMKDQIRRLTEKLREVREDIPGDKFWAIRNELEKLDEKLFERRSLRSENRDCFIEKLREIEVEIHKLKGDRKK